MWENNSGWAHSGFLNLFYALGAQSELTDSSTPLWVFPPLLPYFQHSWTQMIKNAFRGLTLGLIFWFWNWWIPCVRTEVWPLTACIKGIPNLLKVKNHFNTYSSSSSSSWHLCSPLSFTVSTSFRDLNACVASAFCFGELRVHFVTAFKQFWAHFNAALELKNHSVDLWLLVLWDSGFLLWSGSAFFKSHTPKRAAAEGVAPLVWTVAAWVLSQSVEMEGGTSSRDLVSQNFL